jgi:hypothetical protein
MNFGEIIEIIEESPERFSHWKSWETLRLIPSEGTREGIRSEQFGEAGRTSDGGPTGLLPGRRCTLLDLEKGLNFVLAPKKVPIKDFICNIEATVTRLPTDVAEVIRRDT